MADHLFTPVSTAVCDDGRAYVRNDGTQPVQGTLKVSAVSLAAGAVTRVVSTPVDLGSGAGELQWTDASAAMRACPNTTCVLVSRFTPVGGGRAAQQAENVQLQVPPFQLALPDASVSFKIDGQSMMLGGGAVALTVTSDKVGVMVALTTAASGYFKPNWFLAMPGDTRVQFFPFATADKSTVLAQLKATTRIEHLAQHTRPRDPGSHARAPPVSLR